MTLNIKDAERMEVVRKHVASDPIFWSIDNRPLDDLEQRTKDLDRIFTPARGFRVRQQIPATATVEVEAGVYVPDGLTVTQVALQNFGPIPAATGGNIRIDLIWFNLSTGVVTRTAGTEQLAAVGFPALARPNLPSNDGAVPLAYLYIDDVPTPFSDSIAIDTAGCIQDVRPAPGFGPAIIFESVAANLKQDTPGGATGSSSKTVRADHQHPPNYDAVATETLSPATTSSPGVATTYNHRDHAHALAMEALAANLKKDTASGVLGILNFLVKSDHQHPLNVDGTLPTTVSQSASATGSADYYARRDHAHALPTHLFRAIGFYGGRYTNVSVVGFGVTTLINGCSVTIPANTFPNGILVIAQAEVGCFRTDANHVTVAIEVLLTQGATTKRLASDPVAPYFAVAGSGLASLGAPSLFQEIEVGSVGGGLEHSATITVIGVWQKNATNLNNMGGYDWAPGTSTVIDFGNAYIDKNGGNTARVGGRSILVFGY